MRASTPTRPRRSADTRTRACAGWTACQLAPGPPPQTPMGGLSPTLDRDPHPPAVIGSEGAVQGRAHGSNWFSTIVEPLSPGDLARGVATEILLPGSSGRASSFPESSTPRLKWSSDGESSCRSFSIAWCWFTPLVTRCWVNPGLL